MLVDNAIVITEGMLVGVQRGQSRLRAGNSTYCGKNAWPLLGAQRLSRFSLFAPIGLSKDATGEFAWSLFWVLLLSLGLSWFTALMLIPFLGDRLFRKGIKTAASDAELYGNRIYRGYRSLLAFRVAFCRVGTMVLMTGLLVFALLGFTQVKQSFFPSSNTPAFYVDLLVSTRDRYSCKLPATAPRRNNGYCNNPMVTQVASTVGQGAPRFTLPYIVEMQHENYAQLIVRTTTPDVLPNLIARTPTTTHGFIIPMPACNCGGWKLVHRSKPPWKFVLAALIQTFCASCHCKRKPSSVLIRGLNLIRDNWRERK